MTAREEVLARVRRAAAAVPSQPVEVPRGYRDEVPPPDLLTLFIERVEDYRAIVTRCTAADLPSEVARAVIGCGSVVTPPGLDVPVPGAVADRGPGSGPLTAAELDRIDAVVTTASVGIAATGTIVLEHGLPGQGRRALSLVPDRHVCIVAADQVVLDVPQAVARLNPARPQTWISGPSATSDIELNRVEGVHGPRTLHVLVVAHR
ncbi:MAG: lactate utilization protein C [Actinomycetales bacterium]